MITKLPATFLQRFSTKKIEKMWKNRKKSSNNARSNEKLHNSKEQSKHERVADDLGGWARVWATNESVLRIARAGHAYLEYGKLLEGRYEPSDFLIRRPRLGRCDRTVGSGWNQLKISSTGSMPKWWTNPVSAEKIGAVCEMTGMVSSTARVEMGIILSFHHERSGFVVWTRFRIPMIP